MKINEVLATGAPLQLVVNVMDLKELFLDWQEELNLKAQNAESPLLTPTEVAEKYRISKVTLDCWLLSR